MAWLNSRLHFGTLRSALNPQQVGVLLFALAASLLLARAVIGIATGLDLNFEEAQYWTWSQHLDWSYYSKGPLVAWLIALSAQLFGHGEWQVRLFGWLAFDVFLILLFYFARDLWNDSRAGWWAVLLGCTTPLYFGLGQVMTTDVLLFVCWTWGLWAVYRAVYWHRPLAWYAAGAAFGLGALTKLSILLLPAALTLALISGRTGRTALRNPHLWVGAVLALMMASPLLIWNASHDWIMLLHNQGQVGTVNPDQGNLAEFLVGQWLLLSPLVATLGALSLYSRPPDEPRRLVWMASLAVLAFFMVKAMLGKVQPNWAAPAYIGLLALFAGHIPHFTQARLRILRISVALSIALLCIALFPTAFGLPGKIYKDMRGWRQPIQQIARQSPKAQFILTTNYKWASEFAFYWPQRTPVYLTGSRERRYNQFDLWPSVNQQVGRSGLFVTGDPYLPAELKQAFATCQQLDPMPALAPDGTVLRVFHPFFCQDYRPIAWPEPQGF